MKLTPGAPHGTLAAAFHFAPSRPPRPLATPRYHQPKCAAAVGKLLVSVRLLEALQQQSRLARAAERTFVCLSASLFIKLPSSGTAMLDINSARTWVGKCVLYLIAWRAQAGRATLGREQQQAKWSYPQRAAGAQFSIVSFHLCQAIPLNHFNSRVCLWMDS